MGGRAVGAGRRPLTVVALIRRRSLERCRAELIGSGHTITVVAARWAGRVGGRRLDEKGETGGRAAARRVGGRRAKREREGRATADGGQEGWRTPGEVKKVGRATTAGKVGERPAREGEAAGGRYRRGEESRRSTSGGKTGERPAKEGGER
ncbi:hypothetical protein GCM10009828_066060 [Actinoplanes couchii]